MFASFCFLFFFFFFFFFFNDTATTEIYTLSLHDALPIFQHHHFAGEQPGVAGAGGEADPEYRLRATVRSEEHTSELQPPDHLACRLLLEKTDFTRGDLLEIQHPDTPVNGAARPVGA